MTLLKRHEVVRWSVGPGVAPEAMPVQDQDPSPFPPLTPLGAAALGRADLERAAVYYAAAARESYAHAERFRDLADRLDADAREARRRAFPAASAN